MLREYAISGEFENSERRNLAREDSTFQSHNGPYTFWQTPPCICVGAANQLTVASLSDMRERRLEPP
jgi:hypothetical protein